VIFDESWDLSKATTGFPMVSCVIRGEVNTDNVGRMPLNVVEWIGRLSSPNGAWDKVASKFTLIKGSLTATSQGDSSPVSLYKKRFRQGAVLAPRALLFVEATSAGPLGAGAGRVSLTSRRTTQEKKPWIEVESISGAVERSFLRAVHLGETVVPFRLLEPLRSVLPIRDSGLLSKAEIEDHPALAHWWNEAEERWEANKSRSDPGALLDRIDFHGQLSAQLPAVNSRVVFTKAGNTIAAARVTDARAVIDHKLYWAATSSVDEALYLEAILNSNTVMDLVRPLQAQGLFGGRDIDKNVFSVPIPIFDSANRDHQEIVTLARNAERVASTVPLDEVRDFKKARPIVRKAISETITEIDALVAQILK
jgi:hypothetical protein